MNPVQTTESESTETAEDQLTPNYLAWASLREVSKGGAAQLLEILARGRFAEFSVATAQLSLAMLAREIIVRSGGGLPSPQAFISVMTLSVMIMAPALYLLHSRAKGKEQDAKTTRRQEEPPQSGDG